MGVSDEDIAISVTVGGSTVYRTKRRFVEGNLSCGVERGATSWRDAQAHREGRSAPGGHGLLHAARGPSALDPGVAGWRDGQTDRARRPVARDGAPSLAENELKPWRKDMWCIPQIDGNYVARMEDVLDVNLFIYFSTLIVPGAK